jgi:predicted DNA-binding ribbon-helix-helix protein
LIRKHSATLHGHRTSISLEDEFWRELQDIARHRNISFAALLAEIDDHRAPESNLSSSLRVYVLEWIKTLVNRDRSTPPLSQ